MSEMGIEALLRDTRVASLATVDEGGRPHVLPVRYAYADGVAYTVLADTPNLLANADVELLVDRWYEEADSAFVAVTGRYYWMAFGQARCRPEVLRHGPEHAKALSMLRAKYGEYASTVLDDTALIKLSIEEHGDVERVRLF
jgi:nitroimidazol reductase NimA-like FMN-containing flavoprotein (pyridoxamine 5'-phosphate oxidase superfamily)